jgi:hypothetical protein
VQKEMRIILITIYAILFNGCAHVKLDSDALVDNMLNNVIETNDEREIHSDTCRWKNGIPLEHHRSTESLMLHRHNSQLRKREEDIYFTRLGNETEEKRQSEITAKYKYLQDIPINHGLINVTN